MWVVCKFWRISMLCLAVLAAWRGGDAYAGTPCKFSKGLAGTGASGNTSALIANGAVAVTTPAVYKTLYSVDVGIWVDADLAALDPNIPQLALTYYEHANCIYALGLNENTNLGVHNMSFRIAGDQIHFFTRTSPKIPGTGRTGCSKPTRTGRPRSRRWGRPRRR